MQRRIRRSTIRCRFSKGITVFTLLAVLGIAGIAGSIVVSARDGYRRRPKETFARTV